MDGVAVDAEIEFARNRGRYALVPFRLDNGRDIIFGTYCFRSQILLYMKDDIERVHGTVRDRRSLQGAHGKRALARRSGMPALRHDR